MAAPPAHPPQKSLACWGGTHTTRLKHLRNIYPKSIFLQINSTNGSANDALRKRKVNVTCIYATFCKSLNLFNSESYRKITKVG